MIEGHRIFRHAMSFGYEHKDVKTYAINESSRAEVEGHTGGMISAYVL